VPAPTSSQPVARLALSCAKLARVAPTLVEHATFASLLGQIARFAANAQAAGDLPDEDRALSYFDTVLGAGLFRTLDAREVQAFRSDIDVARTEAAPTP
jgi:hypothetical protein